MTHKSAYYWIELLGMHKHPEGGYYKETYRSDDIISNLPDRYGGEKRNFATCIYFLIEGNDFSSFHRLKSDEIWHFYDGSPLILYIIDEAGELHKHRIGNDPSTGAYPQFVIPKNVWFAAEVEEKSEYTLFGCTVSPGFDFLDFELANQDELYAKYAYPEVKRLTR